jgi:hypothetical protein
MTNPPVTSFQQHSKSIDDPEYWEDILRDAGLPSEPPQHRQVSPLPSDSRNDFGDQTRFFDKHSNDIFEAGQQWKQVGAVLLVCVFCECKFYDRAGTKYCCPNHRKRHNEGKVYVKVMCEQSGCSIEIRWWNEPTLVDGKNLCSLCAEMQRLGFNTYEEYLANYNAKHGEYLITQNRQAEQKRKMRLGEL